MLCCCYVIYPQKTIFWTSKPNVVVTFFSLCTTFGNRQTAETLCGLLADWLCVKAEICYDSNTMVMAWWNSARKPLFYLLLRFLLCKPGQRRRERAKGRMACRRTVRQPKKTCFTLIYIICLITRLFPRSLEGIWLKLQVIRCAFDRKPRRWGEQEVGS